MNAHRKSPIARSRAALVLAMVVALAVTAGTALGSRQSGKATTLTALIGSSGPAETYAINNAAKAFTKQTGIQVNVIVASDLGQQLAQGFASGNPPDIFNLGNDQVATYAKAGDLAPLDNLKNVKSFYPSLRAAYTYKGHLYAAPKDFSTLALVLNTNSWKGAKLTSADYPKTWAQLAAVAKKLTRNGQVGLCTNPEFHRLGVFMLQAGGWLVSKDGKTATVNSKANLTAFNFVKSMIKAGSMKLTNQIGAGWGGEGFGKKECAMTIEGNWIAGAMTHDYPTVPYKAVELPAGPAGKGTLQYDGGWGLAAASKNKADAMSLISYLTQTKVEMGNAKAFGVMPSVRADAAEWKKLYPQFAAFLAGADYSRSIPTVPDIGTVLGDFNQQLQGLPQSDPKTILSRVNGELQSILK
ncbi:MAG: multiple sugar transport system substrate-binding protein [Acidimicrobiaceae bacterium]|nr:multiple sugar transport system substrate-binding protein [Acidimicrobiaceae bacterium]